jgi:hypothetical protein
VRGLVASPLGLVGETAAAAAFNDKLANLLKLAS